LAAEVDAGMAILSGLRAQALAVNASLNQKLALRTSAREIGICHVCDVQTGIGEIRVSEIGAIGFGVIKVRIRQTGTVKIRSTKNR
jgi:hypothetical protein